MYQYNTFSPLALSKKYFKTVQECSQHLKKCVEITNDFRGKNGEKPLTLDDIHLGQRLLKLDFEKNLKVVEMLGDIAEIDVKNLIKENVYVGQKD